MEPNRNTNSLPRRNFLKKILSTEESPFSSLLDESVSETGEMVELLSPDGYVVKIDKAYLKPVPEAPVSNNGREGIAGKKLVMVIDLARCKNLKKWLHG